MSLFRHTLLFSGVLTVGVGLVGCEHKEKKETVVDIQTPAGSVEVEKNLDTGEVHVEATRDKDN